MWGEDDFDLEEILFDKSNAGPTLQKTLIDAAQNGNAERLGEILGNPDARELVDINANDEAGSCALIYAACYSVEAAVLELLRFGADPNVCDKNQWSPLMWAVQNQQLGIVQRLVDQGANVEHATESGRSAVSMCVPGTQVYEYFVSQNYIKDESTSFYQAAMDPSEEEAAFQAKLEQSSRALGIEFRDFDEPIVAGAADSTDIDEQEFEWTLNHSSFPLNPRDIPQFLDLLLDPTPPFHKGVQPIGANCLFLVLRHYCYNVNEGVLVGLITSAIQRIDKITVSDDLKIIVYWLVNVHALLFYLERDVTCKAQTKEFVPGLYNLLESIFFRVVKAAKQLLQPLLRPCILDYENIPGIDSIKYRGEWHLWRKKESPPAPQEVNILPPSMDALRKPAPRRVTAILSSLMLVLEIYSVHPVIIQGIYSQLLYWLGATLFDTILQHHRYMARAKAMQIRLNVSNIEDWCHNNDRRPQDDVMHKGPPTYKSLDQLCKSHFSSMAQLMQWLQCFSGFGNDFTNVIATMQELKELNPCQLLYASKNYRSEINEPALGKDYKRYLQDLETHYLGTKKEADTDAAPEQQEQILLRTPPITAPDILLDEELALKIHMPSFAEMLVFWGGGADGSDITSRHYFRPTMPAEISDELDSRIDATDVYQPLEMPQAQGGFDGWT